MDKRDLIKGLAILNIPNLLLVGVITSFAMLDKFQTSYLFVFLVLLLFLLLVNVVFYLIFRMLGKSIQNVSNKLNALVQGNINNAITNNEKQTFAFSALNAIVDAVFDSLKGTLSYVDNISKGNLDLDIKPRGKNDIITQKLIDLNKTLKDDKIALEITKKEEEQRNWMATGLANFSEVLRQDNQELKQMGYNIIKNLLDYINLNQGAIYVLNEENSEDIYFEIAATVAFGRDKLVNKKIQVGEGLVGRCAYEKKTIYMTEIPQDYIKITSGLGDANPNNLLIVPCILEGKVFGLIEVASFQIIEKHQIGFIEKLGESIASTISNTRIRERTNALLHASQNQSEELAAQEEELRQNLEEMETTQEDLRRQMEMNTQMRKELAYEKFLFDTLLEKIPARVFFKDKECRFVKASNSALQKFGMQNYSELAGLSDADLLKPEFAEKTMADERNIMKTREGRMNFIEHEITPQGKEIWKTVSKLPLINQDDECVGTFGIIQDITDFKLAEIESERFRENYDRLMELINNNWFTLILNEKGFIKQANAPFKQLYKVSENEIQNRFVDDFFEEYLMSGDKLSTKLETIINGETFQMERQYKIGAKKLIINEKFLMLNLDRTTKEILMIGIII